MSAPAEICDSCAKTISDDELETGAAISVLGKSYCPGCKAQAMADISLEDLAAPAPPKPAPPPAATVKAPAPKLPPPPAPKAKEPPPAATPRGPGKPAAKAERPLADSDTPKTILKPATRRMALAAKKGPNPAVLVGIGAALALAIAGAFVLGRGGGGEPKKDPMAKSDPGPSPKKPLDPEAARQDKAEQAWLKLQLLSKQPGVSPAELLEAADRIKADCAGSPYESKLEGFRAEVLRAKESAGAAQVLDPLIEELKTAFPADTGFTRYAELSDKFQKAKELAVSFAPERVPELNRIRQAYVERYEEKARPYVEEIEQAANILTDERRYDDAIAKIETFPKELRLSGAWKGLEQLKQSIERKRKLFPPKK